MPLDDVSHGLGVKRMRGPEQGGQPRGKHGTRRVKAHADEEPLEQKPDAQRGEAEKKKVDDMVSERVQLAEIIIERQAQVAERPVLQAVLERGAEKGRGLEVSDVDIRVFHHRTQVIKMERPRETRQVNDQRESEQENSERRAGQTNHGHLLSPESPF